MFNRYVFCGRSYKNLRFQSEGMGGRNRKIVNVMMINYTGQIIEGGRGGGRNGFV